MNISIFEDKLKTLQDTNEKIIIEIETRKINQTARENMFKMKALYVEKLKVENEKEL